MAGTNETGRGSLTPRIDWLFDLIRRGLFDPCMDPSVFFGEGCVLIQAGVEALRSQTNDAQRRLQEAIDGLLNQVSTVSAIYGGTPRHQQEGQHLLRALSRTIRGVCTGRPIDYPLLAQAASDFDLAWPTEQTVLPSPSVMVTDEHHRAYRDATQVKQGTGFWVVWDVFNRLREEKTPVDHKASLPILLFGEQGASKVAQLNVELIFDGGTGFRPDPWFLGLTAMDEGKGGESFHQAMQRAWRRSGLDRCRCRGRWHVRGFRRPDAGTADPFGTAILSGRSAEAAACCALWAALGFVPGEDKTQKAQPLELDPLATISAQFSDGEESARAIRLGPVTGVPEKLKAARAAGLEMILLAGGQDPRDFADHRKDRPGDPVLVQTAGEAFEHLLVYRRTLKNYQDHIRRQWKEQWA